MISVALFISPAKVQSTPTHKLAIITFRQLKVTLSVIRVLRLFCMMLWKGEGLVLVCSLCLGGLLQPFNVGSLSNLTVVVSLYFFGAMPRFG